MTEDPASPPRYPTGSRRALIMAASTTAAMLVTVDSTIANVALTHIQASLSASQDQVVWVLTSYMIATAIGTPLSSWLANRFGRKQVMMAAVLGFTLASMLCGMANSMTAMVGARMLQGACGAALIPLNQSLLLDISPPERVGRAMAISGVGVMIGPVIGPTLGGFLIDSLSWRWVFFINLPIGMLALAGLAAFLPQSGNRSRVPFDHFGFATLSLFLASLQLMLDRGPQLDWFDSPEVWIETTVMVVCAWLTAVHMATTANSFVRPQIFPNRNFALGCLVGGSVGMVSFAGIPILTLMIQQLLGYPALAAGIISLPRGLGTLVGMIVVGQLVVRHDPRIFLLVGLVITAIGMYMHSRMSLMTGSASLLWGGLILGFGAGMMFVPLSTITFSTLSPAFRNEGTALYSLTRNIGNSLGVSFLQMLAMHTATRVQSRLVEPIRPDNPLLAIRLPDMDFAAPGSVMPLMGEIARQALMVAYTDIFWMLCIVAIAMMPLVLALRPPRHSLGKMRKVS